MLLGFASAILADLDLEEVLKFAGETGYDCVEVMCWPKGKAERRYAGVTHIDVSDFGVDEAKEVHRLCEKYGVSISALGYYPNPLVGDKAEGDVYIDHIKKVIKAAAQLGISQMNTFIGRDHTKSVEENWPRFMEVWKDIIAYAESMKVRVGIENCPMIFTNDEWPGGKNLGTTPAIWKKMWEDIPSDHFGLNYDPSHMIWQHMDYLSPMRKYAHKLFHIHAKDVRIDRHLLDEYGIMAPPNKWHTPKLPGMGEIDWGKFFSVLTSAGYDGPVCVEVEDRAYEGSLEKQKLSLVQSHTYLRQFIPKL
ncbi:MAG: sugar phosphate isomerase/epimerase family protein [Bacteroidia bacterium]|nr:sugar phosphate isomerase/epimerase family protein [Bacteroidia bacterium]